jgi:hypothetical protein
MQTNIHALSGILAHDPSVWAGEDISCLRPRGYGDRHNSTELMNNFVILIMTAIPIALIQNNIL